MVASVDVQNPYVALDLGCRLFIQPTPCRLGQRLLGVNTEMSCHRT